MSLSEIVKISNHYGADPEFVLAGGGNTSYKNEEFLYIKGSGTTLATITEDGFVKMNRQKLAHMIAKQYSVDAAVREQEVLADMMAAREIEDIGEQQKRPSVETLLHDLFNYKYVVHTHPAMLNGLSCSRDGQEIANRIYGENIIWIDIMEPGHILAITIYKKMKEYKAVSGKDADIIILQNHGLFIAGNDEDEIKNKTDYIFDNINKLYKEAPDFGEVEYDKEKAALLAPAIRMLLKDKYNSNGKSILKFITNKTVMSFLKDKKSFYPVSSAYSPDHIVYCKHEPLFVETVESPTDAGSPGGMEGQYEAVKIAILDYKQRNGFAPKVIAIQGLGVYAWGASAKNAGICLDVFMDTVKIGVYNQYFGGPLFLSQYMIDFINNWEVESYRQKISLGGSQDKKLEEKISIVTGSAQGFGLGIAEEMLKQGANVAIADLNVDLAAENSGNLNNSYGTGRSLPIRVDVADDDSVKNMVYDTVLAYGGLDIFVSNAGVLKAGGLEELSVKDFEFVTKINYTAFFICTKYASRIMKIQNKFDSDYMTDIIQINSKSGLEGSNKNYAYAGGKFGGIGLVQSFALELTEYNIKVNAICPGNFLTGPLWMDPDRGLFVQYLKAGKVPGAKTVEDIKKFYEAKVPMKRGCEVIDVARALFYIVEQEYETGQAVPVTGGQNMLR